MIAGLPKDLVLTFGPLGGCGDVSLWTTLPERFTKEGHRVFLDPDNLTRNDEIMDLFYAMNPYIEGTSREKPTIGYVNQGKFYDIANRFPVGSIEAVERAHGLPPPYSLAPRIYYEPKPFVINLAASVLIDLSAISSTLAPDALSATLEKMKDRFPDKAFVQVTFHPGIIGSPPGIEGPSIRVNSIFEYVDAMASCYALVCSEAGSQAIAAAVRGEHDVYDLVARPEIISVISTRTFNSRGYTFRGVDYRVTPHSSNSVGDYWTPTEVAYQRYNVMCKRSVEEARTIWAAQKAAREAANAGQEELSQTAP